MLTEGKGGWGLGVALAGTGKSLRFSHGGRDEGFDAYLMATAETGQAVAIMINTNDDSRFLARISEFVAREYHWPGAPDYRPPPAVAITPAELTAVTGLYDRTDGTFFTMVQRNGHLFTSVDGGVDEEFVALGQDRFVSAERELRLAFVRDPSGAVTGLSVHMPNDSATAPRLGPLFREAQSADSLAPVAAARADSMLRSLSLGGDAMRSFGGITPGARKDFGSETWPPVRGLSDVSCSRASKVTGGQVVRHGGEVARVGYCGVGTSDGERLVLVYFTADDLVTDVDLVGE